MTRGSYIFIDDGVDIEPPCQLKPETIEAIKDLYKVVGIEYPKLLNGNFSLGEEGTQFYYDYNVKTSKNISFQGFDGNPAANVFVYSTSNVCSNCKGKISTYTKRCLTCKKQH